MKKKDEQIIIVDQFRSNDPKERDKILQEVIIRMLKEKEKNLSQEKSHSEELN